jgi:serine/threonine-protein kinase
VTRAEINNGDQIRAGKAIFNTAVEIGETGLGVAANAGQPGPGAEENIPPLPAPLAPFLPTGEEPARCQNPSIPGYRILRQLGKGGMGVVFLAVPKEGNGLVALKTMAPAVTGTPAQRARFLREAQILSRLRHPHIVAFQDMGEANGRFYFVMEYVPGADAAALLKDQGPFPVPRAVQLVGQVLEALEYAHGAQPSGYVHRDIKPKNVLVTEQGGRELAKLADFGLARVYQESQLSGVTRVGDMGGTLNFIAPEQITRFREASPAVDQYSAAATLYNLLTGKFIFDLPADQERRFLMILEDEPVPLRSRRPDIPRELAALIHRALAKNPRDRFADVKALRKGLRKFCGAVKPQDQPPKRISPRAGEDLGPRP